MKFVKNQVPEGFGSVIDKFEEQAWEIDHEWKFQALMDKIDLSDSRWSQDIERKNTQVSLKECLVDLLQEWHQKFLTSLDELLESKVAEAVIKSSKRRCAIKSVVYNFSSKNIGKDVIEVLNKGGNYVMHDHSEDENQARTKFERELLQYLNGYRRFIEKNSQISTPDITTWLEEAKMDSGEYHREFYQEMENYKDVMFSKRTGGHSDKKNFKDLDDLGLIVVENDKNSGISILNISDMVKADKAMIAELGGTKCEETKDIRIKKVIENSIDNLESELLPEAKKFMNTFYPERKMCVDDSKLPFLKVKAKVHKMSEEDLENRNVENLKFRPVIDCSKTPVHQYSCALRDYCAELTRKLISKFFPEKSPLIQNGHQFAKTLASMEKEETKKTFMAVADLSSAYSYIFVENLKFALNFAARELKIPDWKRSLFEKIAVMILNNSFVETSGGFYKLGTCLPMGLGMSGEALDLVCLVSEIGMHGKITFPELSRCSEVIEGWEIKNESCMMDSVISYFRYRDDTFTYGEVDGDKSIKKTIHSLGSSFLSTLDLNVELSHFVGSYLDCVFYKKLSGKGFVSLVRRKGNFPITFQHASSNCGDSVINSIIGGEILRHRRICSTTKMAEMNDLCLKNELESRGYLPGFISKKIELRKRKISQDYDGSYDRKNARQASSGIVYGSMTVFDAAWNTHSALKNFIGMGLVENARMPMIVPGMRLKTKYYTKRRYLTAARKYLRKCEI